LKRLRKTDQYKNIGKKSKKRRDLNLFLDCKWAWPQTFLYHLFEDFSRDFKLSYNFEFFITHEDSLENISKTVNNNQEMCFTNKFIWLSKIADIYADF